MPTSAKSNPRFERAFGSCENRPTLSKPCRLRGNERGSSSTMCEFQNAPPPTGENEWFVETPVMTAFIEHVNGIRAAESDSHRIVAAIRPAFDELLADQSWLPDEFAQP